MGQNTDSLMATGILAMMSEFYYTCQEDVVEILSWFDYHVMFYIDALNDGLIEQGIPPGLFYFILGIGSTLAVLTIWAFVRNYKSNQNLSCNGVGKIFYDEKISLGHGHGSEVYSGYFETKEAAVKVIRIGPVRDLSIFMERFSMSKSKTSGTEHGQQISVRDSRVMREVSINQAITLNNDYIVQYHGLEVYAMNKDVNLLIALELCKANLKQVVNKWNDFKPLNKSTILHDIAEAIYFLHESGYVHRDLKPSNILVKQLSHPNKWRIKVADFGATKAARCCNGKGFFSVSGPYGSDDWTAPEVAESFRNGTYDDGKSSGDIYSMGLIFFFVISSGSRLYETQDDICSDTKNTHARDETLPEFALEMDLIDEMTNRNEARRPTAREIRKHPALWDSKTKIDFTATVNEMLKTEYVPDLEANHDCFHQPWNELLTPGLLSAINRQRGHYRFDSVKDLIHAIRNFGAHYTRQNRTVKKEFGEYPDAYIKYWTNKFPQLLLHTYKVMKPRQGGRGGVLKKFY